MSNVTGKHVEARATEAARICLEFTKLFGKLREIIIVYVCLTFFCGGGCEEWRQQIAEIPKSNKLLLPPDTKQICTAKL